MCIFKRNLPYAENRYIFLPHTDKKRASTNNKNQYR